MGTFLILTSVALFSRGGLAALYYLIALTVGTHHELVYHYYLLWERNPYGILSHKSPDLEHHPFVERLVGTVRREYLDHVLFWNARDLESKLDEFTQYYNGHRVHSSLQGRTPAETSGESSSGQAAPDNFVWQRHCRGMFETPLAA